MVDHILQSGSITTDDLKRKYGYDHPPRAIKDVSDQGIPLIKTFVRKQDGKRMAEYRFGDLNQIAAGHIGGRIQFPKAYKQALLAEYGNCCGLCNARLEPRYLQIDHRIPYIVAGDDAAASRKTKDYLLVCGSCNRVKSWSCEHCPNGATAKQPAICTKCYWANPLSYTHIATQDIRRLDLTWIGNEISDYEAAKTKAKTKGQAMPDFVKNAVRRAMVEDGSE
ncbi:MAG: HNH endonuclease [Phycisphaerales bacterium]|nr:HNH endonuclease [Phycisphaerales bacterium]